MLNLAAGYPLITLNNPIFQRGAQFPDGITVGSQSLVLVEQAEFRDARH